MIDSIMNWQEWPYWKKGGIILSLVFILLYIIFLFFGRDFSIASPFSYFYGVYAVFNGLALLFLLILDFIFNVIIFFIIGSVFGLVYNKTNYKKLILFLEILLILFLLYLAYYLSGYFTEIEDYNNYSLKDCDDWLINLKRNFDREYCYFSVAGNEISSSICDKIEQFSVRGDCYYNVAKEKKDINICKLISPIDSYDVRKNCFSLFGEEYNFSCEDEFDQEKRDICYYDKAISDYNINLCEKILNVRERSVCISLIKTMKKK